MPVLRCNRNDCSGSKARITAPQHCCPLHPNKQTPTGRVYSNATLWPSRPGEFHPEPLTDPDLTLSRHPARATARRLPPSIEYRVPPVAG